jgi:uncharacterized protein
MTGLHLQNTSHKLQMPINIEICLDFWKKLKGLMFTPEIGNYQGLLFVESTPSRINTAIHMFFMNYDIAVIWLDKNKVVLDKALAKKWHPAYIPSRPAVYVLETHPNRLTDFSIGDILNW